MKKVIFILVMVLGFAWNCHAQGWTFVQDSLTTASGTCVAGSSTCSITVANANMLPTAARSVLVVVMSTGNSNITISSVTGGGGTWNLCPSSGCHVYNSTLGRNVDAAFNLSGSGGATSITVNASGSAAGYLKVNLIELMPPAGFTASALDAFGTNTQNTCTVCTGVPLTLTATDAVVQFQGIHDPSAWNGWSSPYITNYQGDGIYLNAPSGALAAPTVSMNGSGGIMTALAFSSSGGNFTPPAQPMSVVNYTNHQGVLCQPTCSLTVPSTGAGHLLFIEAADLTSTSISSVSGGGAWSVPAGIKITLAGGYALSGAYALSSTAGATSISVTMAGNSNVYFAVWEVSTATGSFQLDTLGSNINAPGPTAPGVTLSLSGNDVIFQAIFAPGGSSSVSLYPMPWNVGNGEQFFVAQAGAGVLLNTTNGTAPQWTTTNSSTSVTGIAFKIGTGTAPAPPTGLTVVVN